MQFFKKDQKIILLMVFVLLQAVGMSHGVKADPAAPASEIQNGDPCGTFIHQWIDQKNKIIPIKFRERIQRYLGKEVLYPSPVSAKEAPFFVSSPNEIQASFKMVPYADAEYQYKIDSEFIAAGGSVEMMYGKSPVTFMLHNILSASIQNDTYFLVNYEKDDSEKDSTEYYNLYLKTSDKTVSELVHGASNVDFFTLGNNSPIFVMEKGQTFDAHFLGGLYQVMGDGTLKELQDLKAFKVSWDIFDFEGNGNPELMVSDEIDTPKRPPACEGYGNCFFREMKIEKWDGVHFNMIADYFYIEPCDVVRGG
jgi:hypothetical protein